MQILNICEKIKTTVISSSLGICISNIPKDLKQDIKDAINFEISFAKSKKISRNIDLIFNKYLSKKENDLPYNSKMDCLINKMTCIRSYKFKNSYLYKKNKFCNPIGQIEYSGKFYKFIDFLNSDNRYSLPYIIYDEHFFI